MFCKNCGIELSENDKFCFNCGNKITEVILNENQINSVKKENVIQKQNESEEFDKNESVVVESNKKEKNKEIRVGDVFSYVIGIMISFFFGIAFIILRDMISIFGLLFGISIIPFIYRKIKLKSGNIIILRIIIPLIMFVCFCIACSMNTNIENVGSNSNAYKNFNYYDNSSLNSIKEYNGVYEVEYEYKSDNIVRGVIEIKDNEFIMNYVFTGENTANINKKEGICSTGKQDNCLYLSFKNEKGGYYSQYKCIKNEDSLHCEKVYGNDLLGYSSEKKINLKKTEKSFDEIINSILEETKKKIVEKQEKEKQLKLEREEKERKQKEEEMNSYEEYSYEKLARNPISVKGNKVKVTGEIVQVLSGGLRVDITYNGYYYTDTIFVKYTQKIGEDKLLEKDNVTIYGIADGEVTYTTVLGSQVTIPQIEAKIINLNK